MGGYGICGTIEIHTLFIEVCQYLRLKRCVLKTGD